MVSTAMTRDDPPEEPAYAMEVDMPTPFPIILFLATLFALPPAVGQIYKWVDSDGIVHYGDCPPPECASQEVELAPPPSAESVREAESRMRSIRDYERKIGGSGKSTSSRKGVSQTASPPAGGIASLPSDRRCFSSLETAWDHRIRDSREPVPSTPLEAEQIEAVKTLLEEIAGGSRGNLGRYRGRLVETECLTPNSVPPSRVDHYDASWDGDWRSEGVFRIETEQEGRDRKVHYKRFFWFSIGPRGLRFTATRSSHVPNLDRGLFDTAVLQADDERLVFYQRRGGRVRRATVVVLEEQDQSFTLDEYLYVQGELARHRSWEMEK